MSTTGDNLFDTLKNCSSSSSSGTMDENSKKIAKRKSYSSGRPAKKPPSALVARHSLDMKSVKVLVERTKFNEMHIVDSSRISGTNSLKMVNGGGLEIKPRKLGSPLKQKQKQNIVSSTVTSTSTTPKKSSVNGLFRIRKCYVKIPKDKVLIRLQTNQGSTTLKHKRSRGRPRKNDSRKFGPAEAVVVATIADVDDSAEATTTDEFGLKRKTTDGTDSSPPKRGRKLKTAKGTEFFINIGALTRTPSPRRRIAQLNSPEDEGKRKIKKPSKKSSAVMALRHKFGSRFFKSYVKVRRIINPSQVTAERPHEFGQKKKKKNGKNLSVSFLETVEIFGESSDGEDWMDFEDGSFSAKGSRLKRLDNGATDEEVIKCFSTSTPCGAGGGSHSTVETSSVRKSGGILKRKEKISFSPLKEDESSPRKEQLKLANEKIVRLNFEQPPAEEEERETVPKNYQPEPEKETPDVAPIVANCGNKDNVDESETHNSNESILSSTPIERVIELLTPSPSAEKDESAEHDNVSIKPGENLENEKSLEKDRIPVSEVNNQSSSTTSEKDKGEEESFESALETSLNLESEADQEHSVKTNEKDATDTKMQETEQEDGDGHLEKNEESTESHPEEIEPNPEENLSGEQPKQDGEEEDEISEISQVNISNSSDQHFEDASELVATALLDEERNEAEAVLNDVCQMAAAESAALLSEDGDLGADIVEYNSRSNDDHVDDDDDDFTSVLTHPEVERSLQSAASTLVPNSQEIVVAAAASSQVAADIDVTEDTFASVVAEVERFTKDVNPEIYSDDVGITGDDVMMDNVQASNSLDDIFDDDVDDDIISSLRMSSGNIDIGHDKSLPIQVIETEVMAIPNEPDLIFDKPLGTTASILGTPMGTTNDTIAGHGHCSTTDTNSKISLGRIFQTVKSYMMSPGGEKNSALGD